MVRKGSHILQVFNIAAAPKKVAAGVTVSNSPNAKEIPWGKNHNLPCHYLRLLDDSGTANSCLNKLIAFIFADGFADAEKAASYQVNETQTADSLLQDLAADVASLEGVAIRVQYNAEGVRAALHYIPFEKVCKLDDGTFQYNPTYGEKKFDKSLTQIIPAYNPDPEAVQEVLNAVAANPDAEQVGQLYYYYVKRKGTYHYPKPPYATRGGLADIENDCEISIYELEEVKNGFLPNAVLTLLGVQEQAVDSSGNPIASQEQEARTEQLRQFTRKGSKDGDRKSLLVFEAETKELAPVLKSFDSSAALNAMDSITDRIFRKVCRHMQVPPVLVGGAIAGQLGNNQEIVNSVQIFQMQTQKYQSMLQRVFEELLPSEISGVEDWGITTLQPLMFMPAEVIAKLTDDELRALGGLAAKESELSEDVQNLATLLKSLPQNIAAKVMDNMTAEQLLSLVGLQPKPQPDAAPNN